MDKGFAKRLNEACDGHPHVPEYGHGRQEWVKKVLSISSEAARRYFSGASRPKQDKMKKLAKALEVDEAWLSLGITPDLEPAEKRVRSAQVEGAVNAFMGVMQLNGANCAFPDDKDPRAEFVDFYAILRGKQTAFHIALAKKISDGQFKFVVPRDYDRCTVVGIVHTQPMVCTALLLPFDLIDKHKVRRGGYFEVTMSRNGERYITGGDAWPRINNMNDL